MDRAATAGAAAGGSAHAGEGPSRRGHRKCMSDTFAFVAGQVDSGGVLGGHVDFLDEEDELGLDAEDCDNEMMNALLDMDSADGKSEGSSQGGKGRRSKKAAAASSAASQGDDQSEDGDMKDDDPRRAKRIMANRQSAQRSRQRKLQYTSDLEKSVSRLHTEISQLNPQLIFLRTQHQEYSSRNRELRNHITALLQETQYKDHMNNSLRDQVVRMKKAPQQPGQGAPQQPGPQQQPGGQQHQPGGQQPGGQQMGGAAPGPGSSSQAMMMASGQQMMGMHPRQMQQQVHMPGGQMGFPGMPQWHQQQPSQQQQQQQQGQRQGQQAAAYVQDPGPGMGEGALQWGAA